MKKIYISQPMQGKTASEILAERKRLIADAAVALREDELKVLDTLFTDQDASPLGMLAKGLALMAEADAVIFAPGWKDARGCRVEHLAAAEYDLKIIHGKG